VKDWKKGKMEEWKTGMLGLPSSKPSPFFHRSIIPLFPTNPKMRLLGYLIPIISVLVLGLLGCQQVQKPELKGEGPLAVIVPRGTAVPEYHAPLERWRTLHVEALNRGDFSQRECVLCHNPKTGCNQCHKYIGVKEVSVPESSLYWPERKKEKG